MHLKKSMQGEAAVLALSGKFLGGLDHEHFVGEIKSLVAEGHVDVLVDLTAVTYVDSTGLGSLVSGLATLKKNGGRLKICGATDRVENILVMTQLTLVLDAYGTPQEALAAFSR